MRKIAEFRNRKIDATAVSAETPSVETRAPKPGLLPGIAILFALDGLILLAQGLPSKRWESIRDGITLVAMIFPFVYTGLLVLKTRDLVKRRELHPSDAWLCRFSGPLAIAVLGVYIVFTIQFDKFVAANLSWLQYIGKWWMEMGLILAIACSYAPRGRHLPPRFLWQIITAPAALIFLLFVVLSMVFSGIELLGGARAR